MTGAIHAVEAMRTNLRDDARHMTVIGLKVNEWGAVYERRLFIVLDFASFFF